MFWFGQLFPLPESAPVPQSPCSLVWKCSLVAMVCSKLQSPPLQFFDTFALFVFYPWVGEVAVIVGLAFPQAPPCPTTLALLTLLSYTTTTQLANCSMYALPTTAPCPLIARNNQPLPAPTAFPPDTFACAEHCIVFISLNERKCHSLSILWFGPKHA